MGDLIDLDDSRAPVRERRRRWARRELLTAGGVAVSLVGACAAAVALQGGTTLAAGQVTAVTLAGSAGAMEKQSTLRIHVAVSGSGDGNPQTSTIEGMVDNLHKAADFVSSTGSSVGFEQRTVGGTVYTRLPMQSRPGESTPWVSTPASAEGMGGSPFGLGIDPGSSLQELTRLAGVQDLGGETVDGLPTEHFHGTLPQESDAAAPDSAAQPSTIPSTTLAAGPPISVDAYVGADALIHRIVVIADIPTLAAHPVRFREVADFGDFGKPVRIVAPPADQVTSGDISSNFGTGSTSTGSGDSTGSSDESGACDTESGTGASRCESSGFAVATAGPVASP